MKWILVLLLSVNLAVGAYLYWEGNQDGAPSNPQAGSQLNNLNLTKAQQDRLAASESKTPRVQAQPNQQCVRILGLTEDDGLSVVISRLKALEVEVSQVPVDVVLRTDYQVIVGPFANTDLARKELQDISAKGLDSYVITTGRYENALSLGVFSSETGANRKVSELTEVDIDSEIVTREHTGKATMLVIDRTNAALITDSTLDSVLNAYSQAEFERYSCK